MPSSEGSAELNDVPEPVTLGNEKKKEEAALKKQKKEEKERAERIKVKKVSPVRKFCCSIRFVFFLLVFWFFWVSSTAVGVSMIVSVRHLYEDFDVLNMKERIQGIAHGTMQGVASMYARALMAGALAAMQLWPNGTIDVDDATAERMIGSFYYFGMRSNIEGQGYADYNFFPYNLLMAWDADWNEKFAFYRPCRNTEDPGYCDLPPYEDFFGNVYAYNFTPKSKDKIPRFFRDIPDIMRNKTGEEANICKTYLYCAGFANIAKKDGGPIMYHLFDLSGYLAMQAQAFRGWHFLAGTTLRILTDIHANRTGLCVSLYSEDEGENLPKEEQAEFKLKREKNLILNPADLSVNETTYVVSELSDTGAITVNQTYYSEKTEYFVKSDRAICDDFYFHGDKHDISNSKAYLSYSTFDLKLGKQDPSHTVMMRFDYHDPLTKEHVHNVNIIVTIVVILWALTIIAVYLYFELNFLRPLDNMRKMREDLIKTSLAGLDDAETKAEELFGDLTNDQAIIKANGDEISVMLTLQDRVDALFTSVIKTRTEELNRLTSEQANGLLALRVMNLFMRRDDAALRILLPGLLDPAEMANKFRRTTLNVRAKKGDAMMNDISAAKQQFRSLKAVLSSTIAAQYFKAFCTQRGRSSVNSFFFMMDVSWLHQVEAGARDDNEDFLSAMFSDSVSPSPAMSPRGALRTDDVSAPSSDLLVSPETSSHEVPEAEANRPRHSHFAKSGSRTPSRTPSPTEEDNGKPKVPKLPLSSASGKNSGASSPGSGSMSPGRSNVPKFLTKIGEGIAHFIHETYFGKRSLAKQDMRHAALLGCSQIPDYSALRDKEKIVYSPVMYDNLVTAVTKKFTNEVLPQFLNSVAFQIMVRSLMITHYFEKKVGKVEPHEQTDEEKEAPEFKRDSLLKYMWVVTKGDGKDEKSDSDDSSSSGSDDDSSDDDGDDGGKK